MNISPEARRRIMQGNKASNTKPEITVRAICHALGFRFRINQKNLVGKPDLVFRKHNLCIFVHGCFWHTHGCALSNIPASRTDFWLDKFEKNKERDKRVEKLLREQGWRVEVIWECETLEPNELRDKLKKIIPLK